MAAFSTTALDVPVLADTWREQGYLRIRGAYAQHRVAALNNICESIFDTWRQTCRPEIEPGGWSYNKPGSFVMLHVNHPKYHTADPSTLSMILDAIGDAEVLGLLEAIFGERPSFLQANLYFDPPEPRPGSWHRDCQFYRESQTENTLRQAIDREADPPRELHMHIPLVPTAASQIVPGSHKRWDTPEESRIRTESPTSNDMPDSVTLDLEPGDLAFFHVNSLHRGLYDTEVPRRTIAITYGRTSNPRRPTAESLAAARGYVSTYQPWCLTPGYLDGVAPSTHAFFQRFIDFYCEDWQSEYLDGLDSDRRSYFLDSNA